MRWRPIWAPRTGHWSSTGSAAARYASRYPHRARANAGRGTRRGRRKAPGCCRPAPNHFVGGAFQPAASKRSAAASVSSFNRRMSSCIMRRPSRRLSVLACTKSSEPGERETCLDSKDSNILDTFRRASVCWRRNSSHTDTRSVQVCINSSPANLPKKSPSRRMSDSAATYSVSSMLVTVKTLASFSNC